MTQDDGRELLPTSPSSASAGSGISLPTQHRRQRRGLLQKLCVRDTGFQRLADSSEDEDDADMARDGRTGVRLPRRRASGTSSLEEATLLSRLTFWWLNGLIRLGYERPLMHDDLPALPQHDRASRVAPRMSRAYASRHTLSKALVSRYGRWFAIIGCGKFLHDTVMFIPPLLLRSLVRFLSSGNQPISVGVGLAVALFLATSVQSFIIHSYFQNVFRLGMNIRSATTAMLFQKALRLTNESRQRYTSGEIVNMMSNDVTRLNDTTQYLHIIWSGPFQIIVALALLYRVVGWSMFAGVAVMALLVPVNSRIARRIEKLRSNVMTQTDLRVKAMNEVLQGIKAIKLYAWEDEFTHRLGLIRSAELDAMRRAVNLRAVTSFLWSGTPILVSLATFSVHSWTQGNLTAHDAFAALALFKLLRFPMAFLPMLINNVVELRVSLKRLNEFLACDELDSARFLDTTSAAHRSQGVADEAAPVVVDSASYTWGGQSDFQLDAVSLRVPRASTHAVVGPVGSGKSTLLAALLGELPPRQGRTDVFGRVAYVAQEAWILNGTLRDNVLFGSAYDADKYQRVIDVCALRPDLKVLPGGDMVEIGEKGINLSGGQKQRVSLARAVYADADVYLLDDPLSAVDAHVGKHLFHRCILEALADKTVVLVTHQVQYLSYCDAITVLAEGKVVDSGSYSDLVARGIDLAALTEAQQETVKAAAATVAEGDAAIAAAAAATAGNGDVTVPMGSTDAGSDKDTVLVQFEDAEPDADAVPGSEGRHALAPAASTGSISHPPVRTSLDTPRRSIDRVAQTVPSPAAAAKAAATKSADLDAKKQGKLVQQEERATGSVTWEVYLHYFRAAGGIPFAILLIVAFAVAQALGIGSDYWLAVWTDESLPIQPPPPQSFYLTWYAIISCLGCVMFYFRAVLFARGTIAASHKLHTELFSAILRAPMAFFDTTPTGRVMSRFSKDMDQIDTKLMFTLNSYFNTIAVVFGTFAVIIFVTPMFFLLLAPVFFVYYGVQRYYRRTSRELKRLDSVSRSPIYAHFSETLNGVDTIRAYRAQERISGQNDSKIDYNAQAYLPWFMANRWLGLRLEFIGNFIIFASALFLINERGAIDPGNAGLCLVYSMSVTGWLSWLIRMSTQTETEMNAVERLMEYSAVEQEAAAVIPSHRPPHAWPAQGKVEFRSFSARYRPGLDLVLRDINLVIEPRAKIGIVGRTGAGKSTIALALFRTIEAASGSIVIDGIATSSIGLRDLRRALSIIPQDPILFSGTIRSNLDPFDQFSDAAIWSALDRVQLKSVLAAMPQGLLSEVQESGSNFSCGQRQLLCLGRALLKQARVLIMDEATAAVDVETDALIQRTIREDFADCTVLTIAHRLNTILDSDRVLVMDQGRVAEFDTPAALLAQPTSLFAAMVKDSEAGKAS